jgi:hypothetical protein
MEANSREEEVLELIARRTPPGDRWVGQWRKASSTPIEGLVPTLTAYMRATEFKGAYRLEPLKGELYAIKTQTVTWTPPPPEVYDLYGEY